MQWGGRRFARHGGDPVDIVRDTGGDWREQALCAQSDPEMWFPEGDHRITQGRQAKAICAKCPVQTQCLEEALANNDMFGVWGGLTASERHRIRKPAVQRTHCVNGHEYTDENTRITSTGSRRCRKCDTVHTRRQRRGGKL